MATVNTALNNDLRGQWDIDVALPPVSETNFSTVTQVAGAAGFAKRASSGAQNDEVTFPLAPVKPGQVSVGVVASVGPDQGIAGIYIGAVKVGEIDLYNAAASDNNVLSATVQHTDGTATTLTVKMETKNASSTGYGASLNRIGASRQ